MKEFGVHTNKLFVLKRGSAQAQSKIKTYCYENKEQRTRSQPSQLKEGKFRKRSH